jgi:hypothetical protein
VVVTVVVGSPPPIGSVLCSKGILERDIDHQPYIGHMFSVSKLVVPIVGPRQDNFSTSSSVTSQRRRVKKLSTDSMHVGASMHVPWFLDLILEPI